MQHPQPRSVSPSVADSPSRRLAYVLDDEPQVGAIVGKILESMGFTARQFAAPLPCLEEIKKASPELLALDLALGHSDAIEVIRYLEAFKYKGTVLLISGRGYATLAEIERIGRQHGLTMAQPVQKPFRVIDIETSLATVTMPKSAPAPEAIEARVDPTEALRNNWLRLWYQAKIDLKTMSFCGAEALLRVRHPELGLLGPSRFLPAKSSSVYQPLTRFVVLQAKADWEIFAQQGQPIKLSINVPLATLQSSSFVELIRAALPKRPNFPGLMVEVTEGDMLLDLSGIREIATQLKLYNVALSIDDFGSAHSSLSRLRDLPCAELKLDRSYVSGCATDSAKQSVCAAAIELAHGFGLTVCAKGVENVADLRTLIDLGCHTAQGFLFAEPMGSMRFLQMLMGRAGGEKRTAPSSPSRLAAPRLKMTG
jgi:EAL domain-containing protein (putative c-di-GMP-specific phosphodiesterase class I)